ncbi:uncharacterized mitochondrial protein AtMg00810-like [Carya illinoinensis]|uniref:uncharacterized mitochondrial protein AtMg00810-like n=1 Tax=Carya illinoinensis TaxID=32201 RepID=UPI001C721009|nr:uncharacterized mitochondrial protein AtMg00810-like [Carya illinoinensis]
MGTSMKMVEDFKIAMMKEYEMTDLGSMRYFLGIQVRQTKGEVFICQEKYIEDLLKNFHMTGCKPVSTPMSLNEKLQQNDEAEKADAKAYSSPVGSLIYLTNTRLDIVHLLVLYEESKSLNEKLQQNDEAEKVDAKAYSSPPSKFHYVAAKRILRYLQATKKLGIMYKNQSDSKLVGFAE